MTAEPFPKPAAGAQGRPQPEHAPGGPPATPSFGRLLDASLRALLFGLVLVAGAFWFWRLVEPWF